MPETYVFLVERDGCLPFAWRADSPELPEQVESLVNDDLYPVEDQPGMWGTVDGHNTVTRYVAQPVGTFPEDHAGVGVPVVGVAL